MMEQPSRTLSPKGMTVLGPVPPFKTLSLQWMTVLGPVPRFKTLSLKGMAVLGPVLPFKTPQGDGGAGSSPSIQDPEPQGDGGVGSSPSSTEGDKSLETSLERILDSDVDLGRLGGVLPRDAIMPIYDPQFTPGKLASLEPGELVIGVEINGESKAYPVGPLVFREMVNDVVGGVPLLVTW